MSHPYSGAASYIYANEYRTPTQTTHNILAEYDSQPSEKLYNGYQYAGAPTKTVELSFQVQSARPTFGLDDSTRVAPAHRKRAKASRQVVTSPSTTIATLAFSPASQASSLPSHTTSTSRSHSHAYTNSHSSSRHAPNQTQPHAQPIATPNHSFHYHSEPKPHYRYDPLSHPEGPIDTVRAPKKPTPKLSIRTKFKLTLPNPFRQSPSSSFPSSAWPPRSPTRSPKSNWDWSISPKKSTLSRWFSMARKCSSRKVSSASAISSASYRNPRISPNATLSRSGGSQRLLPPQQYPFPDDRRNPLVVNESGTVVVTPTVVTAATGAKRGKGNLRFAAQVPPVGPGGRTEKDSEFAMASGR